MTSVLDEVLVGVVLAASVLYAVYSLGPRAWRPRLLAGAATVLRPMPRLFGLRAVAQRLDAAAAAKPTGACGGCDNCGSAAATPAPSSTPGEVSVPLSKIGRRH